MKQCFSCGIDLDDDEVYEVKGKIFCDDCALGQHKFTQSCDPSAVLSAKLDRQRSGHIGTQGLTPRQKEFYDYIKECNGVTLPQFVAKFGLSAEEISSDLVVLRHAELSKGQKRDDGVYFVLWES